MRARAVTAPLVYLQHNPDARTQYPVPSRTQVGARQGVEARLEDELELLRGREETLARRMDVTQELEAVLEEEVEILSEEEDLLAALQAAQQRVATCQQNLAAARRRVEERQATLRRIEERQAEVRRKLQEHKDS
jgi:chromosome segregation ATPase